MRTEKFNLCKSTKKLLTLITLLTLGVGQMWGAYYITGSNGNLTGWGTWDNMTESSDGIFWYFQAASGNCECKINISKSYDNALDANARDGGFCDTDLGGNTWDAGGNINYWYNSGSYYILVYKPNTAVNTTNKAKVCASTFLPDAGYETTGNTMKYYSNKAGTDQTTSALDRDNGSTTALGTVTTLYLKGFNSKMWQHGSGNIYGESNQHYYYKVHRTAVAAGSTGFTDAKNATSWSAGTWTWGSFNDSKYRYPTYSGSLNENLLSGLGSGNYTMSYYYLQEGSKNFRHPSDGTKFNKLTWTIAVPEMATHVVTSDGTGTGASATPFNMAVGSTLTITVSGTQASSDANSVLYVSFDNGSTYSSTTTKSISITNTTKYSVHIKAKYYNSADDLSGSVYDFGDVYYQGTQTPSLAISSFTQNASTVTAANSGSSVTINASRQNAGSATITYAYSTDNSNWNTIASTTSTSQSWTLPAVTSTTTYYVKASMTYDATGYSDTETFTVYGKKTIKVKDTNSWGANFKIHRWGGDDPGTEYPGETTNITSAGGQWKQVVLYSSSTDFIFCNGSSSSTADANKTAEKTYAGMSDGSCYVIQSGSGASLTLTSTDCPSAPSVTTASASSVATTSATFNASGVNANNDAITAYGFKWGTTDACSSGTVPASNLGAGTTFSASKTGLTNGTTYYYKAYATNGFGTTYGSVQSFRTKYVTTVTLNPQGGTGGTESVTATEGSAMPSGQTAPGKTGYTFGGYYKNTGGSGTQYYSATMTSAHNWDVAASTATIHAKWTPITYTIHFNGNGNTSGSMSNQTDVTYDSGTTITANAFVKTGYNFAGWATTQERANAGTVDRADGADHGNLTSTNGATVQLWAVWTPKTCTVTFDYQSGAEGYGGDGTLSNVTATYDASMPALSGNMPTAANGYCFMGFFSETGSNGTKYYNADKSSAHNWDVNTTSTTTLYAYYKKAEITALTPDAAVVEPEATIGITPTISPTPVGPIIICWEVRYADTDNPLVPQPADMAYSEGKLTFTAPAVSALYKIHASLKTGSACGAGTELSTNSVNVQVAGSHTVTVDYKYSSTTIAASTAETGRPLVWSDPITAPDIFGYKFDHWTAGTGVSLSEDGENPLGEDESDEATIYIKANYNGTLTANYTLKNIVYFKDNLEWTDPDDADAHIYVNLLQSDYWNNDRGSGNYDRPNRNLEMDRVPGTTDIFYYEYDDKTTSNYISFTRESMGNSGDFYQEAPNVAHVVFPSRAMDALGTNNSSGLGFYAATPMFVPLATQTPVLKNSNRAAYYNDGYWTKYLPGTGYTLQIYNEDGSGPVKQIAFTSADELMPMKAVVDLEGGHTYKFQLKRDGDVYYGNNGTMTYEDHGQNTAWDFYNNYPFNMCTIVTNAAGDYTFNLSYSPNNGGTQNRLRMSVDYPVASGDYRLVYTDNTRSYVEDEVTKYRIKPSAIVNKVNDGTDIVSFFVRHNQTPKLYIQQATVDNEGNITWNEYPTSGTPTNQITGAIASTITSGGTGVYNFNLSMNGSGALSVTSAEAYDGEFYIRTDAANSKWDNYRTDPDHRLTSSDYLKSSVGYTHYYCHWVNKDDVGRKNVKFVIANDYSPCISDTLARETATGTWANIGTWMEEGGDLKRSANVRFMWDQETNAIARAYVDGAQGVGSNNFLKMLSADSKIKNQAETETLTEVYFTDNQNWIYEANIKAQTGAAVQLISNWGDNASKITQYFKGTVESPADLIGGSGDTWYAIRLLYDFKTNRLVAAYIPTGTITEETEINADVMFIREHQGDIEQLTFSGDGTITKIETAYGVMKFNKWTLNNKDKSTHNPLDPELSIFERSLYWISFPFRVKLSEVFGFGTYMSHWAIQRYDGARRAAVGHFLENGTFWRWMDRATEYLEPNQGYLLAIDLDLLGESSSVWGPNSLSEQIELYFPSYGDMPDLTKDNVVQTLEPYECTINRAATEGLPDTGNPATSYNRTIFDSHWRVMSVPTYVNTGNVTFANTTWKTKFGGPNFLYTWNRADNTITATSAESFTYHAMHSYMVQYCGTLTWSASSGSPYTPIVARKTYEEAPRKLELRLEIQQNEQMIDRTYVVMSNEEEVSANFAFGEDMVKEFNARKAAIFNYTADNVGVAGNTMPMSEQTTVIPVGLEIPTAGEYTFAIPDGTEGVGVILVDNVANTRTNLSALDYTVNLTTGTHDGRFVLEISPIHNATTGIEAVSDEGLEITGARKMIIDQKLYIVKDGKLFDATGKRVE